MKRMIPFLMAIAISISFFASAAPLNLPISNGPSLVKTPVLNANNIILPVGNTGNKISLMELSKISVQNFETISGRKLSLVDKIGFKLGQKKLRDKINPDGTIKGKALKKYAEKMAGGESGFHLGGFALGFFIGLIGVLIAYLINDDYKSNRVKWAWIGFGTFLVLYIALLVAVL